MTSITELMKDDSIAEEYEKAFWLKWFGDICKKMASDVKYRSRIMQLYKESYNEELTTRNIVEKDTGQNVSDKYAKIISKWMRAHFRKKNSRNAISFTVKENLFIKQNGRCAICGCELGRDWSKIHVDHIVPWELVGDELEDNLQDLCKRCNEEKNASTNYIFLRKIGLK
jgi:CRISPR/Cas system Type II protein with McrA/HNH and RuvC-like nuclease domain